MYDRLLVPTDGSRIAARAGEYAVGLAKRFDASLHAIHVEDLREEERIEDPSHGEHALDAIEALAAETDIESVSTTTVTRGKGVNHAILEYATTHNIDGIVMGTHGRTGFNRFVLGSVAEQTLRDSPIPVITVHEETKIARGFDRILVPTDGSDGAIAAIEHAIELADATEVELHALYVSELGRKSSYGRAEEAKPIDDVTERAREAGINDITTAVYAGRPHQAIAAYATEHNVDCIVMGTHGRSGVRRYLLGSVTERTVRFSTIPVISVKPARVTTTLEYLDFEVMQTEGWSLGDDPFDKASNIELSEEQYGTIEVDRNEYLLEAAEFEGFDWPFHCRAGACVNCAGILMNGEVEMEINEVLSDDEVEKEHLRLTCVSTPASEHIQLIYNAKGKESLRDRVL